MPPYVLGLNNTGDIIEIDAAQPGGNTSAGFATNGKDLLATATGSKVIGIAGFEIYGSTSSNTALEPQAGQTLCFERPPSGVGLKPQWYYRYMPNMYAVYVKNATGSTIPARSLVNLYETGDGVIKMRLADLSSGTDRPAHGIVVDNVTATDPNNKTDHANVQMGSIIGGFVDGSGNGNLTPGSHYWLDPTSPGGFTATYPTATGAKHQVVGYAVSKSQMMITPMIPAEDLGATGGGGGGGGGTSSKYFTVDARNNTGETIPAKRLVHLFIDTYLGTSQLCMKPADFTGSPIYPANGITLADVAQGDMPAVLVAGITDGIGTFDAHQKLWAHIADPGYCDTTMPADETVRQLVGVAISATEILFDFSHPIGYDGTNSGSGGITNYTSAALPTSATNNTHAYCTTTKTPVTFTSDLVATAANGGGGLSGWISDQISEHEFRYKSAESTVLGNVRLPQEFSSAVLDSIFWEMYSDSPHDADNHFVIDVVCGSDVVYSKTSEICVDPFGIATQNEDLKIALGTPSSNRYTLNISTVGTPTPLELYAHVGMRACKLSA